ncbi:MAG: acyl dehydratase [Phenylobacterium zucineum]|nr:MAG: acyl dehydratase [Phenylobacterium zucineum]
MTHINIAGLEVGQEIGSRDFLFTRDALVKYAAASGDFNAIHYRDDVAKSVGLEGVLAHGMLTMGSAVQVAIDWIGDPGKIVDYGVRFTKPVWVDGSVGAVVRVVGKVGVINTEAGTVRIDLTATFDDNAVLGKAQAVVRL